MGMDQWLMAKTKETQYLTEATGACSGLFPMAPNIEGCQQIWYWRKAYDQDDYITEVLASFAALPIEVDYNCKPLKVTEEEATKIIAHAKHVLATHIFDEEGYDVTGCRNNCGWMASGTTWESNRKWEEVIQAFTIAKEIYEKDPDAEVYYFVWY